MDRTSLVRIKFGSHLYGTSTPDSDTDIKQIVLPSSGEILSEAVVKTVVVKTKEPAFMVRNSADDVDSETWTLSKFFELVVQNKPEALDVLFAPPFSYYAPADPLWEEIRASYPRLITRSTRSFAEYGYKQANKYGVKGSRVGAARKARDYFDGLMAKHPGNTKLELFAEEVRALFGDGPYTGVVPIRQVSGAELDHLSVCNRKVPMTNTIAKCAEIYTNLFNTYGARAKQAEDNKGIDWKALSHAVRVGGQAIELLDTGRITFPRPNADYLLRIKTGQMPYAEVAAAIEAQGDLLTEAAERTQLPEEPDYAWAASMVVRGNRRQVVGDYLLETELARQGGQPGGG